MNAYSILLDAPDSPAHRIPIAKLGSFNDSRYGDFDITREDIESWAENLASLPGGRALIDLDHRADRTPRNTEAAGWITGVGFDGDTPVADVEWTPVGEQAIRDKRYLFFSPTYGPHKDETGAVHENTLIGGALTNRPFLNMPALTLASEERLEEVSRRLGDPVEPLETIVEDADSPRAMDKEILTLLDLSEDTNTEGVVAAIKALQAKPAEPVTLDATTLEAEAGKHGKVLLDQEAYATLRRGAEAGERAEAELKEQRFASAFRVALEAGRVVPAEEDSFKTFYALDADATLKQLAERPQIVNTKPSGWNNDHQQGGDAPAGHDAADHALHQKVLSRIIELGRNPEKDYIVTLEQVLAEGRV